MSKSNNDPGERNKELISENRRLRKEAQEKIEILKEQLNHTKSENEPEDKRQNFRC